MTLTCPADDFTVLRTISSTLLLVIDFISLFVAYLARDCCRPETPFPVYLTYLWGLITDLGCNVYLTSFDLEVNTQTRLTASRQAVCPPETILQLEFLVF